MPIIKDKYGAKGGNTRSKFVRREFADKTISDPAPSIKQQDNQLSTQQKRSIRTQEIKEITRVNEVGDLTSAFAQQAPRLEITGVKLRVADTIYQLTELPKGATLKDIIVSHQNGDDNNSVVSIVWSETPLQDLNITSSGGTITDGETGCFRIFSDVMPHNSTISLSNSGLIDTFSNLSTTIYIYAASQRTIVNVTVLKHE